MKRYAIVRVDMIERKDEHTFVCPEHFEGINSRWLCSSYHKGKFVPFAQCKNCRYGDTKEQLVRKIITILRREKKGWFYISEMEIATKIVEFLGVE